MTGSEGNAGARALGLRALELPGKLPGALASTAATIPALASAAAQEVIDPLVGKESSFLENARRGHQHIMNTAPFRQAGQFSDAAPSGGDIVAGGMTLADQFKTMSAGFRPPAFGERFKKNREAVLEKTLDDERNHPFATMVGRGVADVAALLALRAPRAKANVRANAAIRSARGDSVTANAQRLSDKGVDPTSFMAFPPSAMNAVKRELPIGLKRAAETGSEAAFLAALQKEAGGDPVAGLMFGAGGQALGSGSLFIASSIGRTAGASITSWGLALAGTIAAATSFNTESPIQILEGQNAKYGTFLQLGVLSALAGAGRVGQPGSKMTNSHTLSILGETVWNAGRRATIIETGVYVSNQLKQGNRRPAEVLSVLERNPDALGDTIKNRLDRAFKSGKGEFVREMNRLMKNETFNKRLDKALETLPPLPSAFDPPAEVNPEDVPVSQQDTPLLQAG